MDYRSMFARWMTTSRCSLWSGLAFAFLAGVCASAVFLWRLIPGGGDAEGILKGGALLIALMVSLAGGIVGIWTIISWMRYSKAERAAARATYGGFLVLAMAAVLLNFAPLAFWLHRFVFVLGAMGNQ